MISIRFLFMECQSFRPDREQSSLKAIKRVGKWKMKMFFSSFHFASSKIPFFMIFIIVLNIKWNMAQFLNPKREFLSLDKRKGVTWEDELRFWFNEISNMIKKENFAIFFYLCLTPVALWYDYEKKVDY